MPKGKRKDRASRYEASNATSDEDSHNDNGSVISDFSECRSIAEEGEGGGDGGADEVAQLEAFEEKLSEALDGLTQKSAQARTNCFESMCIGMTKRYVPDYVFDRRITICDSVERGLKKGRGAEQAFAAQLATLICIQLGALDAAEEVCRYLKPVLSVTAHDNSASLVARAKCCWALGVVTFLAGGEMGDVVELMQQMQNIFSGSYLKGDGTVPNVSAEHGALHAAAISAWSLLLTLMSPGDVYSFFGTSSTFAPSLVQLSELLQSQHLDVRMSAGEALALVYELGREFNENFADDFAIDLIDSLRQLATDSHKYRAKKDRKMQRATFRDVLHYIEEDTYPDVHIRFGQETLMLDNWCKRKQYDSMCQTLGSGINLHLAENDLLREIFQLGAKLVTGEAVMYKQTKLERHLMNAANFKARTLSRNRNRDKRSAVLAC